jgi:hypothetical protein
MADLARRLRLADRALETLKQLLPEPLALAPTFSRRALPIQL